MTAVVDPKQKKFVMIGGRQSWMYNIASQGSSAPQALKTTGGDPIVESFYPGLAYDSTLGRIVAWQGGDTAYSLDLETRQWTAHTWPGGPGRPNINGTYKRWSYTPKLEAFIVLNFFDRNAYLLRLAN